MAVGVSVGMGVVGGGGRQKGGLVTHVRTHTVVGVRVEVRNIVLHFLNPASPTQRILDSRKISED